MDALVLSTLLFNTLGIAIFSLGMALAYLLPNRRRPRKWVLVDADAAPRSAGVPVVTQSAVEVVQLPHAA